ncbi:universal stress protein [Streptomyces sp. NBC_00365]|uniref:universal stress protein n=1 Tax=Streptomyces sp. NBC_00365 TaxID=2975726 RepID=UPI0022597F69|nr:universal stress protein [Streptomyces sp. NBC_00365]MCX5095981.1 universal stress protein [Streptomyces sp. NBC_00365]
MTRTVTVGLDGSPESRTAAEWAAREAKLRELPLKLVHVWEPVPEPIAVARLLGLETHQHWTERIPREAAAGLRAAHPEVELHVEQVTGRPAEVLIDTAKDAELLVLGSRGLSGAVGFAVGSVGLAVVAHAERPVVLVRIEAEGRGAGEHPTEPSDTSDTASDTTPSRPVVLGLDTTAPDDTLIRFAFEAALRRGTSLRVIHAWNEPPYIAYGMLPDLELNAQIAAEQAAAVTSALRPWRQKFPTVDVVEDSRPGKAANHLVDAAGEASLVVVGRRIRRSPLGAHIGPVTHAVLHHSTAPVVVVPHD